MIMSLANILKIGYAASKAAELGGYLTSGGKANELSKWAGVAGQVFGAGAQIAGAVDTKVPGDVSAQAKTTASTDGRPTQAQLLDKGVGHTGTKTQLMEFEKNYPGQLKINDKVRQDIAKTANLPTPNTGPDTMGELSILQRKRPQGGFFLV